MKYLLALGLPLGLLGSANAVFKPANLASLKAATDSCLIDDPTGVNCCFDVPILNTDTGYTGTGDCGAGHRMNDIDTSLVTDFIRLFQSKYDFIADISAWDTSAATSFYRMFYNTYYFAQDLSCWDLSSMPINPPTSGVDEEDMGTHQMFRSADGVPTLCGWDNSHGTYKWTPSIISALDPNCTPTCDDSDDDNGDDDNGDDDGDGSGDDDGDGSGDDDGDGSGDGGDQCAGLEGTAYQNAGCCTC